MPRADDICPPFGFFIIPRKGGRVKTQVRIDIPDWVDEWLREEVDMAEPDAVGQLTAEGYSAGQIARMAASARLNGKAPDAIMRCDKLLYYAGARREIARQIETRKRGKIREYIGRAMDGAAGDDEEGEEQEAGYVRSVSPDGLRLAEGYLLRWLPGHVLNHLRIVAANGGDASAVADELCAKIGELARVVETEMAKAEAA